LYAGTRLKALHPGVALERGLRALQTYFRRYGLTIDVGAVRDEVLHGLDRFGVLK